MRTTDTLTKTMKPYGWLCPSWRRPSWTNSGLTMSAIRPGKRSDLASRCRNIQLVWGHFLFLFLAGAQAEQILAAHRQDTQEQ